MTRLLVALVALLVPLSVKADPKILVMGDSMLAAYQHDGRSVGDALAQDLGADVTMRAVPGARMIYRLPITGAIGFNIPKQFRDRNWDYVVLNGGGNDLWMFCGCNRCDARMNAMIREDGRAGAIPRLAMQIRQSGAKVIWLGYLRSPGFGSPIEGCKDEGDELEARIARMAALVDGIYFVSNADLVPHGDTSFHGHDRIHPSPKGTRAIAARAAEVIRRTH